MFLIKFCVCHLSAKSWFFLPEQLKHFSFDGLLVASDVVLREQASCKDCLCSNSALDFSLFMLYFTYFSSSLIQTSISSISVYSSLHQNNLSNDLSTYCAVALLGAGIMSSSS